MFFLNEISLNLMKKGTNKTIDVLSFCANRAFTKWMRKIMDISKNTKDIVMDELTVCE